MFESKFIIAIVLFWAGFISSISFMEAWLKFRVNGVTLPVGLSIGKKIFTALNRIEWIFLVLYFIFWVKRFNLWFEVANFLSLLILVILIVQTAYLLPRLKKRADTIIEGKGVDKSFTHISYISMEFIKVALLLALGLIYANQFIGSPSAF